MEIKRKFARVFSALGKAIVLCGQIKGYFLDTGVFTHVDFPSASQTLSHGNQQPRPNCGHLRRVHRRNPPWLSWHQIAFRRGRNIMNRMIRRFCPTLGAAVISCAFVGVLPGDTALAFNPQEVGGFEQPRPRHRDELTFTEISFPGAFVTAVNGINDRGQITGAYIDAGGTQHGFLLDGGVFTTVDFPGSAAFNLARGINDRGQIVGRFAGADAVPHSFLAIKKQ
jgi:hypothetical protein